MLLHHQEDQNFLLVSIYIGEFSKIFKRIIHAVMKNKQKVVSIYHQWQKLTWDCFALQTVSTFVHMS